MLPTQCLIKTPGLIFSLLQTRSYAVVPPMVAGISKKKLAKMGGLIEKKQLPVETDAKKLVAYVCGSNILKEGEDIQLKADSEYPEWLWTLNTGKPPKLEELDPESKKYWLRIKKMAKVKHNRLTKLRKW